MTTRRIDVFCGTLHAFRDYVDSELARLSLDRPYRRAAGGHDVILTAAEGRRVLHVWTGQVLRGLSADHVELIVRPGAEQFTNLDAVREHAELIVCAATPAARQTEERISAIMRAEGEPYEVVAARLQAEEFERGLADWA